MWDPDTRSPTPVVVTCVNEFVSSRFTLPFSPPFPLVCRLPVGCHGRGLSVDALVVIGQGRRTGYVMFLITSHRCPWLSVFVQWFLIEVLLWCGVGSLSRPNPRSDEPTKFRTKIGDGHHTGALSSNAKGMESQK